MCTTLSQINFTDDSKFVIYLEREREGGGGEGNMLSVFNIEQKSIRVIPYIKSFKLFSVNKIVHLGYQSLSNTLILEDLLTGKAKVMRRLTNLL